MQTLRDAFGNIVTWQSADGSSDDLGALTASIAHEVSQPLSGIVNNANACLLMLAANPPDVDAAREAARRTIRDGRRASDVVASLRTMFDTGELALEPVNLSDAAQDVIALAWHDLQRHGIVVRSEWAHDLPAVLGDRIKLQQVILNLVRNACDAMSTVTGRPRLISIGTERHHDDGARVTVRDSGVGLDPRSIDRLFDTFYTTKRNGMGIGLSLCRSIVEKHHGRLWAQPNDGPGATFSIFIPRSPESVGNGRQA
jgi:signal transduction histidine kinase